MTDDVPASVIKTPYTKDEQRVADFLRSIDSAAGKDPIGELIEECTSLNRLFEMMYAANRRGCLAWRAKNPGNELVLPDQANLVEWLLDELSKATDELDTEMTSDEIKQNVVEGLAKALNDERARSRRMEEALREIADHWACSYDHKYANTEAYRGSYGIGIVDGHRAAALIAKAALEGNGGGRKDDLG